MTGTATCIHRVIASGTPRTDAMIAETTGATTGRTIAVTTDEMIVRTATATATGIPTGVSKAPISDCGNPRRRTGGADSLRLNIPTRRFLHHRRWRVISMIS
jgi:hypothetical protein